MPRPKVHPENRLRAYEACLACRATKKRCSGTFPCAKCIRLGRADTCVPARRASARRPNGNNHNAYPSGSISANRNSTSLNLASSESQINGLPPSSSSGPAVSTLGPGPLSPETPHRTHPRMLRNLRGERVYIGKAASLSFLQLVRDTVTQCIGPSQFSHNMKSEDMLETESPDDIPLELDDEFDVRQQQYYVQAYSAATSGFMQVLSEEEVMQLLEAPIGSSADTNGNRDQKKSALLNIVIAIGAQASKHHPLAERAGKFFFACAQRSAFAGMLENPSLDLVRLFLLMSYYMLGACRRNAAFMYLGVAVRAAVALGLQLTDLGETVSTKEQDIRARVWMSLCVLDLLVSSILGRAAATTSLRSDSEDTSFSTSHTDSQAERSLVASFKLSKILDDIITGLYGKQAASVEAADALLTKLKDWSDELPESLLAPPGTDYEQPAAHQHIIGNLHVACTYHFAVIIVTRPFLISALGFRLAQLNRSPMGDENDEHNEELAYSKLATACVDSALYMIQTCSEVFQSRLFLGNMCILKAFIFAAGLVLGFSMFSQKEAGALHEETYDDALDILRMLSERSAQAAHYLEILSLLKNAVYDQRQRLAQNAQQTRSRYVSKLFSLNDRSLSTQSQTETVASVSEEVSDPSQLGLYEPWPSVDDYSAVDPAEYSAALTGWGGMELPLWDSFPFNGPAV
ncbi:Zn(II)2Cys6 transcription factor [Aspergillus fijiensis CBS 313.89]|uniref:Zn(II)2Cys6 transcription factor n=1 Tax=Aspergillus fijiensis CBS 313.89 TaxID=1448319 RepID=A0A8G1VVI6_9EURO|nr:Zn(II)2Cys6 transcription factor [Aspergillus fijiensis CBS 313.89]RAK73216.1 Zn(II)2Cys6 transcription factor [Aspergillus fijiensis CBS 313.89]